MSKAKILILDDEKDWVAKHKLWLEEAGFICEYAYDGREAVEKALSDRTIKIAIIDEILLEKDKYGNTVTQALQGGDVRDDIRQQREDIYFIIISSKPIKEFEKWPNDYRRAFIESSAIVEKIRREKQVVNFFHKYDFENPEKVEQEYHVLIKNLKEILTERRISPSQIITPEFPSLYIGLGVDAEILKEEGNRKSGKIKPLRRLFASQYQEQAYQEIAIDRSVRSFYKGLKHPNPSTPLEKKLLWLEPNATLSKIKELKVKGKRNIIPAIKPDTRPFQILEWLAWQVELREEPTINADQFLYDICGVPRPASGGGRQDVKHFQQEQGKTGIHTEAQNPNPKQRKRLTIAISLLSTKLVEANIGFTDNKQLFRCDEGSTTYTALFKTGILLYPLTPSNNKS